MVKLPKFQKVPLCFPRSSRTCGPGSNGNECSSPHPPKPQNKNRILGCSLVSYRTLLFGMWSYPSAVNTIGVLSVPPKRCLTDEISYNVWGLFLYIRDMMNLCVLNARKSWIRRWVSLNIFAVNSCVLNLKANLIQFPAYSARSFCW